MASTVDLVQCCFTWLELRDNVLWPQPVLPAETGSLEFQLRYRSHWFSLQFTHQKFRITVARGWLKDVKIGVKGSVYTFKTRGQREFGIG